MTKPQSIPPVPASLAAELAKLANLEVVAGAAVTVARDGEAIGFWGAGCASLPFRVPVTERTLFHIGSVGKHITALALMQLVDAGRVRLAASLGAYVTGLPEAWAAAPVRSLLTHTSGLPDYGTVITEWDRPQGRDVILAAIGARPPLFRPGEAWAYSNTNYLVLGWLIEAVGGEPYAHYLRDHLFRPAALPTARGDSGEDVIADRAEPYDYRDGRFLHAVRIERSVSAAADGGVLFSASDIAPWSAALSTGRLASPALMAEAVTPVRLASGRQVPYGFGWFAERTRGHSLRQHAGRVPGFGALLIHLPAAALWVAVMANTTPPPPLQLMALTTAEAFAPGSTYLSLPSSGNACDPRTLRVRAMLERGDAPLDPDWFAPEMQVRLRAAAGGLPPRLPAGTRFERLEPIESYAVDGGRMLRYRAHLAGHTSHYLFGFTEHDRIFWAS
jgi:CubicO group peptidase (beta-lactamase class C family)